MSDFSDLLRRAKEGDSAAVGELLSRFERRIDRVIRLRMGRDGDALRRRFDTSDLRQSVFREVLHELPRIEDFGEDAFLHLLYMKAQSRVARAYRRVLGPGASRKEERLGTEAGLVQPAPGPGPATRAEIDDQRAAEVDELDAAAAALTPEQREIVKLRSAGLKFRQIADRMSLPSEGAARMRYQRALKEMGKRWTPRST